MDHFSVSDTIWELSRLHDEREKARKTLVETKNEYKLVTARLPSVLPDGSSITHGRYVLANMTGELKVFPIVPTYQLQYDVNLVNPEPDPEPASCEITTSQDPELIF